MGNRALATTRSAFDKQNLCHLLNPFQFRQNNYTYTHYTLIWFFQKRVEVAVEDTGRITHFDPGAVVFYQLVWVQNIRANLAPPLDFACSRGEVGYFFFTLLL